MRKLFLLLGVLCLVLVTPSRVVAQVPILVAPENAGFTKAGLQRLDALLEEAVAKKRIGGAVD